MTAAASRDLPRDGEKRAVVEAMFDRIAPRYDLMNRLMTLGLDHSWRRRAVAALELAPGARVLDLACGSGDLAAEAARQHLRVVGVDLSRGMLARARARSVPCALVRGDALRLPLPDASLDGVVSGFALRNFVDVAAAFRECGRVLRPGGRVALLEVDRPAGALARAVHGLYFARVVPLLGALVSERAAYAYLPASVAYLPDESALLPALAAAGFADVTKRRLLSGAVQLVTARRTHARVSTTRRDATPTTAGREAVAEVHRA